MNKLLVVGGASIDTLHFKDRTLTSAGGAGMYTAMAARRCGVQISMFGPNPDPCPEILKPVAEGLNEWLGPVVPPEQIPRFEISYIQGFTEYVDAAFGAEATLSPDMLPIDLSKYDHVHVTPARDALLELDFVKACRERGARCLSAGTYPVDAREYPQTVRAIIDLVDIFFMNLKEAKALYGSLESVRTEPGKFLFITMGKQGACVIQGDHATLIPADSATEEDPTGAGDTFCGTTLACLLKGKHPIMAARQAVALAAEMIAFVGPTALLLEDTPSEVLIDPRVQVNDEQVHQVAEKISTLPEVSSYPFVIPQLPPIGHPKTMDYFFAATLHQFSFWTKKDNRYDLPLIDRIGGVELKGSDYLWESIRRAVEKDADFCSPQRQANLSRAELLEVFRADNGDDPMPALDLHLEQAHQYGRDMEALQLTPEIVLQIALESHQPLQVFLSTLDHIGGYKEDPLRKKSSLLILILNERPEQFFPLRDDEEIPPVIDYHLLRSCLRVGLVDVLDDELNQKLIKRQVVSPEEEWAVRYAAYRAMEQVVALSSKSSGAVGQYFFFSRKRCPEMTEPICQECQIDPVCAHRKELFQPVLRTTFY